MALTDQPRLLGLALGESFRRAKRRIRTRGISSLGFSTPAPERILIAPQDLRTADPTRAQDFYEGRYHFAGRDMDTRSASPFDMAAPSNAFAGELNGFTWFRHLSISNSPLARSFGQRVIREWTSAKPAPDASLTWDVSIASDRLISWIMHAPFLLEEADAQFYRLFMRSIGHHIRYLRRQSSDAPFGMARLKCFIALAYAATCVSGQATTLRNAHRNLGEELNKQIYPDGGHVSRNPGELVELLLILIPLKHAMTSQGEEVPETMVGAMDRMMLALRFFRHSDGSLARFHGMGVTEHDLLATVLRYDPMAGEPLTQAPQSGFQRLAMGGTRILMDTGAPNYGTLSSNAHASALAFELSSGRHSIIVNCGTPFDNDTRERYWRYTAAHSTVVLNNASSCRFQPVGSLQRYLSDQIVSGPQKISIERQDRESRSVVIARHDGYVRPFNVLHERSITLAEKGRTIMGIDRILDTKGNPARHQSRDDMTIRFHVHPAIDVTQGSKPSLVTLSHKGVPLWQFACTDLPITIEDGIHFATHARARPAKQIVLTGEFTRTPEIRWMLQKVN